MAEAMSYVEVPGYGLLIPVSEVERVVNQRDRYREALRETIDLCNALREYAPTLNMAAEKRLRDSLALLEGGS